MSHWNYRVVKSQREREDGPATCTEYTIREVYYNDDETIYAMSQEGMSAYGETLEEVKENATTMLEAFKAPVLNEWEIKFVDHNLPD